MMDVRESGHWRPPSHTPVVFVIDDDVSVRESLELLLMSDGRRVEKFATAEEFLAHERPFGPSCLVLDVNLPDLNGIDLQSRMAMGGSAARIPIIFITGCGEIRTIVRAMKAGAIEFLTKPFDHEILLNAVDDALKRSSVALSEAIEIDMLRQRYAALSVREQEVMRLVIKGMLNKQVGAELGISEITVKAHRGRVMRKLQAESLAALVVLGAKLGIHGGS
jgi:FixJ family two-component response regulator